MFVASADLALRRFLDTPVTPGDMHASLSACRFYVSRV